jgi:2-hydroxy-3-oxopropionate reductase
LVSIGRDGNPRVGFIGLGIMGRPMATNVLRAGFPLVVRSLQSGPIEALVALGAQASPTPKAVAASTDIIIVMVPTIRDLEEVMIGVGGLVNGLRPGAVVVAMGTYEPEGVVACAAHARGRRASLIDAPVSGGEVGAQDASLSIMVGGSRRAVAKAMPVLSVMGSSIVHVGDVGAGQIAKACNQLIVASTIEAVAEALALAAAAGVDPRRVREAMRGGFAASRVLELHGQRMLDGNFVPGGRVELHAKDARIVLQTARNLGVALPGFEAVAKQLEELIRRGDGLLDHSALITLVDEHSRSGLRARSRRELPQ